MNIIVRTVISSIILVLFSQIVSAQDLLNERIWKISSKKRSIFFDKGIFHSPGDNGTHQLKSIRNSYIPSRKYERIVFDFDKSSIPKIYGHIAKKKGKVYVDFFKTNLEKDLGSLKNIKYVKNIDFFNLDVDKLSVELSFVDGVSYDVFYLENPGRLVIDVKK